MSRREQERGRLFSIVRLLAMATAVIAGLPSCETTRHQFAQPTPDWETKAGQLQYHGPKITLTGDVLVRFSKAGDFELIFSKGASVALIKVQQDTNFARVEGALARGHWAGPTEKAPSRLRGWLALRDLVLQRKKATAKLTTGPETFRFEF